jgi:hypothetical protein
MTTYQVTVTYLDGETVTADFESARKAERFAREEVKWETTARAICPALDLDLVGSFASYHPTN